MRTHPVDKLLEQHWNKSVESNNLVASCQQAGNKQCEHILLTSCWNSIATSLPQVCYNLCVLTCVMSRSDVMRKQRIGSLAGIEPVISVQRSKQLSYRGQLSSSNRKFMYIHQGDAIVL